MLTRSLSAFAIAAGLCPLLDLALPRVQAAQACSQLMESRQPNVTINAATAVAPGAFAPASGSNAAAKQALSTDRTGRGVRPRHARRVVSDAHRDGGQ